MQIVIDIPEEIYFRIMARKDYAYDVMRTIKAVERGKVLPKGHGALKDADKLAIAIAMIRDRWNCYGNEYESAMYQAYDTSVDEIIDAPTIIEADKEETDADSN